jgi:hypothetical protein
MKTFTKEFMQENCGCYSEEQLQACSFMKQGSISLSSIIQSEIPLKDKFWFVCKKVATIVENKQMAIECAETVLPIYESGYPENKAPRETIEACKLYITGRIDLDALLLKRRAAAAAAVDAAADDACYAAVYAAVYATYAAYDDAYAAYDAAYAAYAAVDAAADDADADIKDKLQQILIDYCNKTIK